MPGKPTLNPADVLKRAIELHAGRYTYGKFVYRNKRTKVVITCPVHGDFEQLPLEHATKGAGCKKCADAACSKRLQYSTENFVKLAKEAHGDRYDYAQVRYVSCQQPVQLVCRCHGPFEIQPTLHLRGHGCAQCGREVTEAATRYTQEDWLRLARAAHGSKYDYTKSVYKLSTLPVIITCPVHGDFEQTAGVHSAGHGCAQCMIDSHRKTQAEFLEDCERVHGTTYSYDRSVYESCTRPVTITCAVHGDFEQTPLAHIKNGSGCPKCISRRFSKVAVEWLEYRAAQDRVYIQHAMNDGEYFTRDVDGKGMYFDGYAAETNTAYEFLGDWWHGCPAKYDPDAIHPVIHKRYGTLWAETLQKMRATEQLGYNIVYICENEWTTLKRNKFFD